jgi:hypothetical protein
LGGIFFQVGFLLGGFFPGAGKIFLGRFFTQGQGRFFWGDFFLWGFFSPWAIFTGVIFLGGLTGDFF